MEKKIIGHGPHHLTVCILIETRKLFLCLFALFMRLKTQLEFCCMMSSVLCVHSKDCWFVYVYTQTPVYLVPKRITKKPFLFTPIFLTTKARIPKPHKSNTLENIYIYWIRKYAT